MFIYGENGSGKSSFYYALKDFFQSSTETLSYDETENIFLTKAQKTPMQQETQAFGMPSNSKVDLQTPTCHPLHQKRQRN